MRPVIGSTDKIFAKRHAFWTSVSLLLLRIGIGVPMLAAHGWGKLNSFSTLKETFPDPIGLGPGLSLILAIFAEVFCSIFIIIGLGTRLAAFPLAITMLVAFFIVHGEDPFAMKELALIYLVGYVVLLLSGAGRFSIDKALWPKIVHGKPKDH